MKRFVSFVVTLAFFLVVSGCATPVSVTRTFGDGQTRTFQYLNNTPLPVENKWVKIDLAGFKLNIPQEEFFWVFGFQDKIADIKKVEVYEVSKSSPVFLISDSEVKIKNERYYIESDPIQVSKENVPWLYTSDVDEFIFKFVLFRQNGEQKVVYQPSVYMPEVKQAMVRRLNAYNQNIRQLRAEIYFDFDDRGWEVGHGGYDQIRSIIEYVLPGETVDDWNELITWQHTNTYKDPTIALFLKNVQQRMESQCPDIIWNVLAESESDIVYEWHHGGCGQYQAQHEISRIFADGDGFHRIAYTIKTTEIFPQHRELWLKLIRKARFGRY